MLLAATYLASCSSGAKLSSEVAGPGSLAAPFTATDSELRSSPRFIVYGDMRFTDIRETSASQPGPRRSLVARIAKEQPDAVFLTGDVPWHGGNKVDYQVFKEETDAWRNEQLRVFPVLGNHEFKGCAEAECLAHWWHTFPQQSGRRWYSVRLGTRLQFFALDSDSSLLPGGEQEHWLQQQLDKLSPGVRFVVILLHHPPITDYMGGARGNETALAKQLAAAAKASRARFIVCAAHVHNYERFKRDDIVFLVSGGGGGKPEFVNRSASDLYQNSDFPNFHYLRFELTQRQLRGEMVRMTNAPSGPMWSVRDHFELDPKTP
jgi:acid phosphatase type 7